MDVMTTAVVLAWVAIVILALGMSGLLRQIHELRQGAVRPVRRLGPDLDAPAPSVDGLASPSSTVFLFADDSCVTCETVVREAPILQQEIAGAYDIVALYRGEGRRNGRGIRAVNVSPETFERYGVRLTPYAVAVDDAGVVIAADLVGSTPDFRRFLASLQPETSPLTAGVTP